MDPIAKAAAKGEELRKSGWSIKGIWVSQGTESADLSTQLILLLKMASITPEQMKSLHAQVVKNEPWWVLHNFGGELVSIYPSSIQDKLLKILAHYPPMMVWEAASERRARVSTVTASNKRSGT